jgi:thiosulfate dehydrogenase [quinone] large subunit
MSPRPNDRAAARRNRDPRGSDLRSTRDPRPIRDHRDPGHGDVRGPSGALLFRALLPLRFFLGATFVYAGIDKLLDPAFLQAAGPGSIGDQLTGFVRFSPLAPLVEIFAQPMPVLVGVIIAVAEIGIGLGALTGLLYRVSAAGGAALSLLFWLTASWATKPYYYGPDLPYAFGWLTVALAGHGGLLVLEDRLAAWAAPGLTRATFGTPAPVAEVEAWSTDPARRGFLQLAALGAVSLVVASVAGVVGRTRPIPTGLGRGAGSGIGLGGGVATAAPTGAPLPAATTAPGSSPAATQSTAGAPSGQLLATLAQLKPGQALAFQDSATGDPALLVRLADGSCVAYDAICTHNGCTVEFDQPSGFIFCPCHGAVFDPTNGARPVQGPTDIPLATLPIRVDSTSGRITLTG